MSRRKQIVAKAAYYAEGLGRWVNLPLVRRIFNLRHLGPRTRWRNEALIRGATQSAFLGDDTALCRVLGRYKMYVDTRDMLISSHLMLDGYWEMWTTEIINDLVKPGMVVADIGANLGYFTLLMGDLVGPAGRVHAFEPNPEMTMRLRRSIIVNGLRDRTELHQLFLGRTDGEPVGLHVLVDEPGGGSMVPVGTAAADANGAGFVTHRLDSRADWSCIQFAKIDVEGAEEAVLDGAEGMLAPGSALRTIVLEFAPSRYADANAFLGRLEGYGFTIKLIDPYRGVVGTSRGDLVGEGAHADAMLLLQR